MMSAPIVLIAAVAGNNVIGSNGDMPWRLRSDMRHFRAVTMGKPIIMGRKTYQSIGKPLDGRTNIVVTRSEQFADENKDVDGLVVADNLDAALALAEAEVVQTQAGEICVIGGGEIYSQIMDRADRLEITEILESPDGDTHFPVINPSEWSIVSRTPLDGHEGDTVSAELVVYCRASRS